VAIPCLSLVALAATIAAGVAQADDAFAAAAQPPNMAFTVADVTLGEHVAGEPLTPESLLHRVVMLAFWSREDAACIASLPVLEQAHRALAPAGLLVIASHSAKGSVVEVRQTTEKAGLTFPIVDEAAVKGMDLKPLPHVLLFDHTGKCVARGSPQEMTSKVVAAVRDAPPVVLAGRHLEKLPALERMLRDESKFGAVLRKAAESAGSADEPTADEAKFIIERLTAFGEQVLAKADALKAEDAHAAAGQLQRVAAAYRGNDLGKRASDLQREWSRDKQFAAGLQAANLAAQLEAIRLQALTQPSGGRPGYGGQPAPRPPAPGPASMAQAGKIPPPVKAQMAQIAGMVRQLSPGSRYAKRAEEIAVELNLELPAAP
jgi:hypothetical protein